MWMRAGEGGSMPNAGAGWGEEGKERGGAMANVGAGGEEVPFLYLKGQWRTLALHEGREGGAMVDVGAG